MLTVSIQKPRLRWLFGGLGFHNSEATMTRIMKKDFYEQRVLKSFRELSPSFARVFAGYADWSREAMDAFADYYDETFRKAGTTLYLVPGRMPLPDDSFDIPAYCEQVAANLEYLVKERGCRKIRYYCVTNELSCGNTYAYLSRHLELLRKLHGELYHAFKRHGLDIGLLATDCSGIENFGQIPWAIQNMDELTECYCAHLYWDAAPGDLSFYPMLMEAFSKPVAEALAKEKRFVLGEFGLNKAGKWDKPVMRNDVAYCVDVPEDEGRYAIALAEFALAAMNSGCQSMAYWTMVDYPDPFFREDGDSEREKALYDVARFSGHGLSIRYNKHGLIRWNDEEGDYGVRASYYTLGRFARLFCKGSIVLSIPCEEEGLRFGGVTNADGSLSLVAINWKNEAVSVHFASEQPLHQKLREYVFEAEHIPENPCGDLPKWDAVIPAENGEFTVELPALSCVFLTTDYQDRKPKPVVGVMLRNGCLVWKKSTEEEHCYYRVYRDGVQIASTAGESLPLDGEALQGRYTVHAVDRWGNESR